MVCVPRDLFESAKNIFEEMKRQEGKRDYLADCLEEITGLGIPVDASLALFAVIEACEEWKSSPERRHYWEDAFYTAEFHRGYPKFLEKAERRNAFTTKNADLIETLYLLGFSRKYGPQENLVSKPFWRPFVPGLVQVWSVSVNDVEGDDPVEKIYQIIRQRVRRCKRKLGTTEMAEVADEVLEGVYATF